jgi:hypothetical protein
MIGFMFREMEPVGMGMGIDDAQPFEKILPVVRAGDVGESQGVSISKRQGRDAECLQKLAAVQRLPPEKLCHSGHDPESIFIRGFLPFRQAQGRELAERLAQE